MLEDLEDVVEELSDEHGKMSEVIKEEIDRIREADNIEDVFEPGDFRSHIRMILMEKIHDKDSVNV